MAPRLVKDLMISLDEYATIRADQTIAQALEALGKAQLGLTADRHQHRAVLVLDERGDVLGKLSHWAVLRSLETSLLRTSDLASLDRAGLNEDLIQSLREKVSEFGGSLEHMCAVAGRTRVSAAMVPVGQSIDETSTLAEAVRVLVRTHAQSLPVTRGDRVVGILRLSDVFEAVADLILSGSCSRPPE